MDKKLLHISMGLLLLFSCQKEGGKGVNAITFAAPSVETKAPLSQVIDGSYPKAEYFSVIAATSSTTWNNGSDPPDLSAFIGSSGLGVYGVSCGYNPGVGVIGAWDPQAGLSAYGGGTAYYWENAGENNYLQAQAYSPTGAHLDMNSGTGLAHSWDDGFTFTNFTTPVVGCQYDLMYSDRVYNQVKGSTNAPITIHFFHALASLVFKVSLMADYNVAEGSVKLKSLTLKNVYRTGTFQQGLKTQRNDSSRYQDTFPKWTVSTPAEWWNLTVFNFANPVTLTFPAMGDFDDAGQVVSHDALLLIPQKLNGRSGSDPDMMVEIVFTLTDPNGSAVTYTYEAPLADFGPVEWEAGKEYVYLVRISPTQIMLAVNVIDWNNPTNVDLT